MKGKRVRLGGLVVAGAIMFILSLVLWAMATRHSASVRSIVTIPAESLVSLEHPGIALNDDVVIEAVNHAIDIDRLSITDLQPIPDSRARDGNQYIIVSTAETERVKMLATAIDTAGVEPRQIHVSVSVERSDGTLTVTISEVR